MVILAYWGHHYSRVEVRTADKVEDIVEEGMVDEKTFAVEAVEEVGYGGTGSLDGSSSIQETKNFVGLVVLSKGSRIKILHQRLTGIPLVV